MLRVTLAMRITLIVLVSLLAVWIVTLAGFYRSKTQASDQAAPAPGRLAALVSLLEQAGDGAQRSKILAATSSAGFRAQLLPSFEVTADRRDGTIPESLRDSYAKALAGRPLRIEAVQRRPRGRMFPRLLPAEANGLKLEIGLKIGGALAVETRGPLLINRLGLPVGFGAGLFGTLIAVAALLIMQRETRPLARLAAAVDRLDLTRESAPLPESRSSAPEIRAVTGAFNRMQARLGHMMRARMALIGGISHDVRTFATRLRLRVEHIPDPDERARAVADIEDMIRLLDDALLSSRAGAGELNQELVDFPALLAGDVEDRQRQGRPVALTLGTETRSANLLGDRLALRRIVANLVDNALAYGGKAHLSLRREDGMLLFQVDDEGPGIPEAQREMMLEPFARLEASRNRKTGGAGLGLAVVRSLVEGHGGSIEIGAAPGGGARVSVRLPVFQPQGEDAALDSAA